MTAKITKPGIYDIPNGVYHSQCCDGPSISSTGLRKIRMQSPAHFWNKSDLNPDAEIDKWTPNLNFGAAAHSMILEGTLPEDQYVLKAYDNYRKNEAKKWRDDQLKDGLIIFSKDDLETITGMAESLAEHPLIKQGLFKGEIERSLFWQRDGVWLKARPDVMPVDNVITDFKTVARGGSRHTGRAVIDYGYHIQAAMICDGVKAVTGRDIDHYSIMTVEKDPPYVVTHHPIMPAFIDIGRYEYRKAFEVFKTCLACLLYTSPSPRDQRGSRMPSSA